MKKSKIIGIIIALWVPVALHAHLESENRQRMRDRVAAIRAESEQELRRALRPDAPKLGNAAFGIDNGCILISCCDGNSQSCCCPITPISETGFDQTIVASGSYCLATDLEHTLTIAGNSITLYMKGHAVFVPEGANGIVITGDVLDVRIFDGAVDGQSAGSNIGIVVEDARDVRIEDVTCVGCNNGIRLNDGTVNAVLLRVSCSGNVIGLIDQNDLGTTILDSSFNQNEEGFSAQGSESLVMEGCTADLNTDGMGFEFLDVSAVEVANCVASKNFEQGFRCINGSIDVVLRDCYASSNTDNGFSVATGSSDIVLTGCTAERNTVHGFFFDDTDVVILNSVAMFNGSGMAGDGFHVSNSTILVRKCAATSNVAFGFTTDDPANQFYSNVACNNGTNYDLNVVSAPVRSPFNMRGVQNVDCADTTPDSVEIILSEIGSCGGCSVTPILVDAPITLTTPGRYCLAVDFNNTITISGTSVTLDLNGHTVNVPAGTAGILIATNSTDIRVKNGFIKGDGATSIYGIQVEQTTDVRIEDVTCEGCTNAGIFLDGSQRTFVNRVNCNQNATGLVGLIDLDTVILNSSFTNNAANTGMSLLSSQRLFVQQCVVDLNTTGIFLDTVLSGEIAECVLNANTSTGIFTVNSSNIVIRSCSAQGQTGGSVGSGFFVSLGTTICLFNCAATLHDVGFRIDLNANTVLMRECSANANSTYGFLNQSTTPCFFYANDACNNPTNNYLGVVSGSVVGANVALYWQNVDCTL